MQLSIAILLIVQHFIFDWACQTRWMANNKSKNIMALMCHVFVVTVGLFWIACIISGSYWGWNTYVTAHSIQAPLMFAIFNGILHFVTDFFTSRLTSHFWQKGQEKWFFTTIGFDQMLHYFALLITAEWMF